MLLLVVEIIFGRDNGALVLQCVVETKTTKYVLRHLNKYHNTYLIQFCRVMHDPLRVCSRLAITLTSNKDVPCNSADLQTKVLHFCHNDDVQCTVLVCSDILCNWSQSQMQ